MYYKRSLEKTIDENLFKNPTCEYRGTPFWAWNCKLDKDLLLSQIDSMKDMGFGGFHMHSRVGMATPYLQDEFMDIVRACVDKAKSNNMLAHLYDEDRWPSGAAGGIVTKDISKRQKYLFFTNTPYIDDGLVLEEDIKKATTNTPRSNPSIACESKLIACYDIVLDEDSKVVSYKRIDVKDHAENEKWYLYAETMPGSSWYNGQSYIDTMDAESVKTFLKVTHERYKEVIGDEFDKTVPSIFSDEPQVKQYRPFAIAGESNGAIIAYTTTFSETFKERYGYDIIDKMPEVFFTPAAIEYSKVRHDYFDHIADRFAQAFSDTIGDWCKNNNISMTGHMMDEPRLYSQTKSVADCMRQYRGFQIPGIDILSDNKEGTLREYTTAKQCQSAVHQYGREGMLSELYGVTGWDYDFRGHKCQGDWQAALGVTVRVPHLFWVSMRGQGKRDYPASIGEQSPWYKQYGLIEDHFARTNVLLTRGTPKVDIAVLHPIESYWLFRGPDNQSEFAYELDRKFRELCEILVTSQFDFDYVNEGLLPNQYQKTSSGLQVGKMNYKVVVVPNMITIRRTTFDILREFKKNGGEVIFTGVIPYLVDCVESNEVIEFAKECKIVDFSRVPINNALSDYRFYCVQSGSDISDDHLGQTRNDGDKITLFICHAKPCFNYDASPVLTSRIIINGEYKVTEYNTQDGSIKKLNATYKNGKTIVEWVNGVCDSILLQLENGKDENISAENKSKRFIKTDYVESVNNYELEEPNVLLLDKPEYKVNGENRTKRNDILYTQRAITDELGMVERGGKMYQPWVVPKSTETKAIVELIYTFESKIDYSGALLALESIEYADSITLNGVEACKDVVGYYVDREGIQTINVPDIKKGINTLVVKYRMSESTQLESMYLLGKFGVRLRGEKGMIVEYPEDLPFGDLVNEDLAFYSGNVTYKTEFVGGGHKVLEVSKYSGALIGVILDGKRVGSVIYPPYRLDLGVLDEGKHTLDLVLYGNRFNTFSIIHNINDKVSYPGPAEWTPSWPRLYTPEYNLKKLGILTTPRIHTVED